jgi:uncharacterized protein (DUF885 family)
MSHRLPLAWIPILLLAACSSGTPGTPPPAGGAATQASAAQGQATAQRLDQLFEEYWEAWLELNPVTATFIGDPRYNDRYTVTIGPEYRQSVRALFERNIAAAEAVDPAALDEQRRLSRDLFLRDLRHELEGQRFPQHLLPLNQFYSAPNGFAMLGSGTSAQPFATVRDYGNFLQRVDGFSAWVEQAIANMREGIKAGIVQPAILMERTIPQLEAQIVATPDESSFYLPIANFPDTVPEAERERLREAYEAAISERIVPAYARLRDFIRDEYLPACRDTVGLDALPDGAAWYAHLVRNHTTTDLDPHQIHQIGLDEVARIHAEMEKVMAEVGFEGELADFFDYLNTEPEFYFSSREEMIEAHEALRLKADAAAPMLFERTPKAGYEIRAVEAFRERSAAKGSYQRPSADGSRPGIFYVNTYNADTRPKWDTEALFLHEAVPGHHFQRAFNLELGELPAFRRHGGVTAFAEGWGLYAESLEVGQAMGFYEDPYQRFGELNAELWRAIRLVVDTGLHAKGWTREQVLEFMYANSASLPTRAESEAERFMAIPGQALAYKIGQLKISELRARAEGELGQRFDIREFHAQVLGQGDLPLDVLETRIDAWIGTQDGRASGAAR